MALSDPDFLAMITSSTFFRPAGAAYSDRPGVQVSCDRCRTQFLPACFHVGTLDLCLACAHTLLRTYERPSWDSGERVASACTAQYTLGALQYHAHTYGAPSTMSCNSVDSDTDSGSGSDRLVAR